MRRQTSSLMLLLACLAAMGTAGGDAIAEQIAEPDLEGLEGLERLEGLEGIEGVPAGEVSGSSWIELKQLKGFLATEGRFYLKDAPGTRGQLINEIQAELDLRIFSRLGFMLRPRFLVDAIDTSLHRYEPLEAYVTVGGKRWSLLAGQFIDNWGIADAFNPLDLLNRRDLGTDLVDPPAMGELGARLQLFFPGGAVFGQPTLALYLMPLTRGAVFPTSGQRFSFEQIGMQLDRDAEVRPGAANGILSALRFSHTLSTKLVNADLQYVVARGPDRFPFLLASRVSEDGAITLVPQYFGVWAFGGGLRAVPNAPWWSKLTLKAELVYKLPYRLDGIPEVLPDHHLQYVVGFDRIFSGTLLSTDQLTLTVEYIGEHLADDPQSRFRPFEHDVALRLFWEAGNFARSEVELRGVVDVTTADVVVEASYEQQLRFVHDDLRVRISAQAFRADRDGQRLFAFFPNNSNIRGELRYDF